MSINKEEKKKAQNAVRKELKRKKKNALIECADGRQYWTTQSQFWQWVRDHQIVKIGDYPLTGKFVDPNADKTVVISNTILSLACPNHLREALSSRRYRTHQ